MSLLTNFQDLVRTLNHVLAKKADKTDVSSVESKVDSLSTVAQTGSYNDLNNKPTLSVVAGTGEYSDLLNKPSLASVATSGDYHDLSNTPTIPAAQIQSDWNQSSSSSLDYIKNKPNLATVATSGSYNDLSNQPTIPNAADVPFPVTITNIAASSATLSESWTDILAAFDAGKKIQIYASYSDGNILTDCAVRKESGNLYLYARYFWWSGTYTDLMLTDLNATYVISSGTATWNNQSNHVVPTIPTAGTISNGSQGYAKGGDVYTALLAKQNTLPTAGASSGDVLYWTGSAWATEAPPSGMIASATAPADTSALWIDIDDETVDGTIVDGSNMAF